MANNPSENTAPPPGGPAEIRELDLRGLKCPLPAMRASRALTRMTRGQRLIVRATDPMSAIDVPHALATSGARLVSMQRDGGELTFLIER